ncbi:MAG: acetamidase/formamidase family protein [Anaerolineae bacterium]|nr:acetamidase/formamidase family protein [Anaerolineae bacterium]
MPQTHTLEPELRTLHGYFSPEMEPVLTIDPGDSVIYRTPEGGWRTEPPPGNDPTVGARFPSYDPAEKGTGHALVGPIAIRGAHPGMTLAVQINAIVPGEWGVCFAGGWKTPFNERYNMLNERTVHTWALDIETMTGCNQHGHGVALRPFMGVMGMPPPDPGRHTTIPPRIWGGNLDCKELVAGSTLYLPIPVEGALFSTGDGHGAQGDGEVSGIAIECPMEQVDLTFTLHDDFPLKTPIARTPAGWVTMGLGDTLDDATYAALDAMFTLMQSHYQIARVDAIALASVAVDLRITQIVDVVVGVHALLPHGAIR